MNLFISSVIYNRKPFESYMGKKIYEWMDLSKLHILESFYSLNPDDPDYFSYCGDFLLDSGAFSMMNSKNGKKLNIKDYCIKYGEFVKKHNIDNFIELDVDGVYGVDVYKDCLHQLQDITGKDPLRVFHPWRGIEYYKELVKQKDRICIGSIAVKLIRPRDYYIFDYLLDLAHQNNCKVHGLGVGSISNIRKYNFDSTDSASWLTSVRNGQLYKFNGHHLNKYNGSLGCTDDECINRNFVGVSALKEWEKYSKYLEQF